MNQFISTIAIFLQFSVSFSPAVLLRQEPKVLVDPIINVQSQTPKKIATLSVSHFEAIPKAATIKTTPSASLGSKGQSSTDNLANLVGSGCGDNVYANYIYTHESGCRLTITNAEGCVGIGQACPASKLTNACPNLDYACQNNFFTNYANSAYGGWAGAYNFWLQHRWW